MKDIAYNQVNPLVRLKELELLTTDQFALFLHARDLTDFLHQLQSTAYGAYDLTGEFERILQNELTQTFKWAYENSPSQLLVHIFTLRYTYHNLKLIHQGLLNNQDLGAYFIEDGRYNKKAILRSIQTVGIQSMSSLMIEAIQEATAYYENNHEFQGIDIIYDRYYLNEMRWIADQLAEPTILKDVIAFIDLTNLAVLFRGLKQKRSEAFFTSVLSHSGSIQKKELLSYIYLSPTDLTATLLSGTYNDVIAASLTPDGVINPAIFDQQKTAREVELYNRGHQIAFGPLPLLGYLNAKKAEVSNLRVLYIGKHNRFDEQLIKERMRLTDGN